jgi:membrane-bound metal-dependent hydrolase YbcI (DUF457 family)
MYWDMLFLAHLVIGLIIGFMLYEIFHARTIIVFCAIGSVLPDLVDKGLGHIIFSSSLDNGRIFFHSLFMILLFLVAGLIVWKYYRSFAFLVVGFGILLHQLADSMWTSPASWYYPLSGPYPVDIAPDYFQQAILSELTSVTEWILFAAIVVAAFVLYRSQYLKNTILDTDPCLPLKTKKFLVGLAGVSLFVLAISVTIIAIWHTFFHY